MMDIIFLENNTKLLIAWWSKDGSIPFEKMFEIFKPSKKRFFVRKVKKAINLGRSSYRFQHQGKTYRYIYGYLVRDEIKKI